METEQFIKDLSLKQKLNQMFIAGFKGENHEICNEFHKLLSNGLGGVIFFTENIQSPSQIQNIIRDIKISDLIRPFLCIDQEGGRVERTENIHKRKKYLSAKYAYEKGEKYIHSQTKEIARELKSYGINMNFAPVLDVNTNDKNPIIGERAFSNNPDIVSKMGSLVIKTYEEEHIIPVAKHFPGHGDASLDSHIELPTIALSKEDLEQNHVKPFVDAIANNIPAIMVAHVHYPSFDKEKIPASMSKNIINDYLIQKLNFNGIIISDDMVMGAMQEYTPLDACIKAINAGVNMFIFRNTDEKVLKLIDDLESAVLENKIPIELINKSVEKIILLKRKYKIINI